MEIHSGNKNEFSMQFLLLRNCTSALEIKCYASVAQWIKHLMLLATCLFIY